MSATVTNPTRPTLESTMIRRPIVSLCTVALTAALSTACIKVAVNRGQPAAAAQTGAYPERAIKHDIPMTNIIRRAMAAGTRDSTGRPGRNYWQLRTDYTINVSLNPTTSMISGNETIVIHNNSPAPLTSIGLRLDQNIFRAHAFLASPWVPAEVTDGMVISKLSINGQNVDLNAPAAGGAPGGRAGGAPGGGAPAVSAARPVNFTQTNASIVLPTASPIPANGSATLQIEWSHKVAGGPNGRNHRMTSRWADSLYQMTQWYPRVSVYDDLRGWDPEIYLGPSEFYNNFGKFDVTINVPAGWVVGGTGVLQNPEQVLTSTARARLATVTQSDARVTIVGPDEIGPGRATANATSPDGMLSWHFVADTVNDFAWGTARKYVWEATRATIPGRAAIPIHMYYLPDHANLYRGADIIGRHALEFYSKLWMPYEFPQMTMIDGPSAGMEYPMVVMSNRGAEDHEMAHSWWPMMVSNNETWYGWMDEGFNQYMNILSGVDNTYKGAPTNVPMPQLTPAERAVQPALNRQGQSYGRTSGSETEAPMMWNGNYGGTGYSFHTYGKTPLMLSMLGGIVSDSAVQRAQSEYAKAWKFKHPSPWDYMFFMNNALHQDLGWFWTAWLFRTDAVQGSIQGVTTTGNRTAVTVRQDGDMPSPVVLRVDFAATGPAIKAMPNSTMENATSAIVTWPVSVWWNGSRTFIANLDFGGRKIEKITFDPYGRFPDRDATDNVWPRAPAAPGR